jgi:hypothetical protein
MELTPEEDQSTASRSILQMFKIGRDSELTDQDRRSLGAALRHAAWESQTELSRLGIQGGIMFKRLEDMAELIGGSASEEEIQLRNQIEKEWEEWKAKQPKIVLSTKEMLERI